LTPWSWQWCRNSDSITRNVSSSLLAALGAAYGTAKSGTGIAAMSVMRPELIMKSIIPVVMAGIIAIYGLVVAVLIGSASKQIFFSSHFYSKILQIKALLKTMYKFLNLRFDFMLFIHSKTNFFRCMKWLIRLERDVLFLEALEKTPGVLTIDQKSGIFLWSSSQSISNLFHITSFFSSFIRQVLLKTVNLVVSRKIELNCWTRKILSWNISIFHTHICCHRSGVISNINLTT